MVRGAVLALGTRDDRCAAAREEPLQGAAEPTMSTLRTPHAIEFSRTSAAAGAPMLMRAKAQGTPDAF